MKKILVFTFVIFSLSFISFTLIPKIVYSSFNDWPMFRRDTNHTGYNPDETTLKTPLSLKWSVQPGYPRGGSSSSVSDGIVYTRTDSYLYALDSQTGKIIWSKNSGGVSIEDATAPTVSYGMVYVGNFCSYGYPCGVVAYDAKTGTEKWHITLPKGARGVNVYNGVVYFGSDDWYVRAANAYTGELFWTSPKLNDGVTATPAVASGKVFVGTWGGLVYGLDSTNGQIVWQFPAGGVVFSSPAVVNDTLFVGSGSAYIYALATNDGTLKWKYGPTHDSIWSSPAVYNDKLFIQDLAGYVYALDTNAGMKLWSYKTNSLPSSSISSPAVANGVVYVGSQDGYLYAFDVNDGTALWKYDTGYAITYSSPAIANGIIYINSGNGKIFAFDNVQPLPSSTPTPTPTPTPIPLPSLDVPGIKQYSSPWGSQIYDTANLWSSSPFISRWGCALTSAAMVLKYFGYNVTPETLNNWLKSQVDGYIRNGLLNWLAVSRYTKLNPNSKGEALEYKRLAGTDTNLIRELTAGRPGILEEPGHFVIAKSQLSTTFGINDPAYDRTTLDSYSNTFNSIGSYKPSQTDLSYIFLVTDPSIVLSVYDPSGNPINGYSYTENPLSEDSGSSSSGSPLGVFAFPQPTDGQYRVILTGNGTYNLESYLYNKNGDVNKSTFAGLLSQGQEDSFDIITTDSGGNQQTRQKITINTLIDDLESAKNQGFITKSQIYNLLKTHLLLAKGMSQKEKTGAVKGLLNSFYYVIRAFTPKFINQNASSIFQAETTELLNSL